MIAVVLDAGHILCRLCVSVPVPNSGEEEAEIPAICPRDPVCHTEVSSLHTDQWNPLVKD